MIRFCVYPNLQKEKNKNNFIFFVLTTNMPLTATKLTAMLQAKVSPLLRLAASR